MEKFIVVAGNIGSGKTTLVEILSQRLGFVPFFEPHEQNPYLADFYEDMKRWSYHSQVYFLTRRLKIHKELLLAEGSVVQDRSVYEDAEIFAHNLFLQGHINERDYHTYRTLYQTVSDFIPPPDLVIYLRASVPTLQRRISLRDRDYERTISDSYLEHLNHLYEEWLRKFLLCTVLTVPADDLDYVAHSRHLDLILAKVQEKLTGKDEVVFSAEEVSQNSD